MRNRESQNEKTWLRGVKTFEASRPPPDPGVMVSSRAHPFQSFQWADYSAKPAHDYTYTVLPLYGPPANLTEGQAVSNKITTESEWGPLHSVFFNRGANEENMLVIRDDKRVADIYLGEFMRMHAHYAFREAVGFARKKTNVYFSGA